MTKSLLKNPVFKLKGRLYTLTVMQIEDHELDAFSTQLKHTISQAPLLFKSLPLVLDCTGVKDPFALQAIYQCLCAHHLCPIAVQGGGEHIAQFAQQHGLAVLNGSATQDQPISLSTAEPALVRSFDQASYRTTCHTMPVRSGQQLVARNGELLVIGSVSPGAELLAAGHIYIYGALRGRALAGINGDQQARIFCQSLQAELISIAGVYRLSETIQPVKGACQIYLQQEQLIIEPICLTPL